MNSLAPAARTEIFRTRVSPDTKAAFARCSAAKGMRSGTYAHQLMLEAIKQQFGWDDAKRKEAKCRPLKLPASRGSGFAGVNRPLRV